MLRSTTSVVDREHGQIIVLFALVLVVILAFAAIVVDLGLLRNNRQTLVNAMDAAALAGGTLLPVDGSPILASRRTRPEGSGGERPHRSDASRRTTRACRAPRTRSATSA